MNLLRKQDYIKFVLADTDVKWFKELYPRIKNETLATITVGLFHHPENKLTYPKLMTLIQKMSGRISLNFQSHKMLWGKSDDSDI
jgi:organic radical activating enzyme